MKKIDIVLIELAVVEQGLNLCVHACVLALVVKFVSECIHVRVMQLSCHGK